MTTAEIIARVAMHSTEYLLASLGSDSIYARTIRYYAKAEIDRRAQADDELLAELSAA